MLKKKTFSGKKSFSRYLKTSVVSKTFKEALSFGFLESNEWPKFISDEYEQFIWNILSNCKK